MYRPLGDRVLVRQDSAAEESKGGIIIPDVAQERPMTAKVLAVGESVESVKAGASVMFSKFGGTKVKLSDYAADKNTKEELIVLRVSELLLVD